MKKLNKKSILLLIMAAVILMVSVVGTVAYLATDTAPVVNTFKPAEFDTEIEETFPDPYTEKEDVYINNPGEVDVYVRAKVVGNWCDEEGNIVTAWNDNIVYNAEDWEKGGDGYYYHKGKVAAGGKTGNLFDSYTYTSADIPAGAHHLEMTILHQSVQAEPAQAVMDLWGEAAAALVMQ